MSGDSGHDLSGHWSGIFNYPSRLPPTQFEAELRDIQGAISGETTEPDVAFHGDGRTVHATIEGNRSGSRVRFTKAYIDIAADAVLYEGTLTPEGDEITGIWEIPGHLSGTFLMIRGTTATKEEERGVETAAPAELDPQTAEQ